MTAKKYTIKIILLVILYFSSFGLQAHSTSDLGVFISQILENNPAIQAAESNVAAAQARAYASGQPLYNPELSGQKQYALENQTYLELSQTFDWADKRGARKKVGAANARVAIAELRALRQQLAAQILTSLAKYQAERRAVTLAKERTSILRQFVTLTRKRYTTGDIARVDLDLAQLAYSEALAQQADTEVTLNQALQSLSAITGFTRMNWPRLSFSLPKFAMNSFDVDNFINTLPAISVLSQRYQTARARFKLAQRERYPDPTFGIQGGKSASDGESKRLVGLTFSIPLFVRNPYRAEVDAANYDAIEADAKRADLVRQARAEIMGSATRYQALYQATQQWQQISGKPLGDGMTLIDRLWQAGEINSTEYIFQLKQRIDSQIAGVELKGRAWQAWAEWLKASGQIEGWLQLNSGEHRC